MGPGRIHPRVLRELVAAHGATFHHFPAEGPVWHSWKKEWLEGGSREPRACQPDPSAGKGHGADPLECHRAAHAGQPGHSLGQPGLDRQVLLDPPDLLGQGDPLSGCVCLHFSKASDTVSHSVFLMAWTGKHTVHWVKDWLESGPREWWGMEPHPPGAGLHGQSSSRSMCLLSFHFAFSLAGLFCSNKTETLQTLAYFFSKHRCT